MIGGSKRRHRRAGFSKPYNPAAGYTTRKDRGLPPATNAPGVHDFESWLVQANKESRAHRGKMAARREAPGYLRGPGRVWP